MVAKTVIAMTSIRQNHSFFTPWIAPDRPGSAAKRLLRAVCDFAARK